MLRLRTDAWYQRQEKVGYHETSSELTKLKKQPGYEWLNDVSSVPVQQSLRHLNSAFANFFAKRAGYPRFKRKDGRQSAEYTASAFKWVAGALSLAKMDGTIKVRWSRSIPSAATPTTVTVTKDTAGRYFVSLLCDDAVALAGPVGGIVGIDVGLTHLVVLSTGEKIGSLKPFHKNERRLRQLQKSVARKTKGSMRRRRAKLKVAKLHAKIADTRKDSLHKLSRRLVNENQVLAVETLSVSNMRRNRKVSKAIGDAGWAYFLRLLEYKSSWSGRTLVGIDRWYPSSKRCSNCGHVVEEMGLRVRRWNCPECGSPHDRDVNAAQNILAAGLAVLARGEVVSPVSL